MTNTQTLSHRSRSNGNVARLPKSIREKINQMIQDGVSYPDIIETLGEHAEDISAVNLSRWKNGGYQDWLTEQQFIERLRARQETPSELVRDFDATEVNHAALQLGTLQIFEALRDLGPGSLDEKLGGDAASFARLLNALARASRETMQLQKYRQACAEARAALEPMKDPKRKLSDDERHAIVQHVDEILGLDQAPKTGTEANPALGIITLEGKQKTESQRAEDGGQGAENLKPETGNLKPESEI